ncbi:hypothetical protein KHQ06_16000 [Nocardia tengchongensis]|uniref:Uncharacterized protein n=1 Tax=Nocardia tengchongensis TaxID=2055889 RepID=A0ABX8CW65_9NOCA|nr:hypothetical protein [Nocardia tengchongensis]QVI24141.1 hypothetical protein KHQ06_16000 [Nocardia tengchongensis]
MQIIPGELPLEFNRKFHLSYTAGHSQVLFRSNRLGYDSGEVLEYGSNVEILFKNVAAIAVHQNYFPLKVSLADNAEIEEFCNLLNCDPGDRRVYALRGDNGAGYVLAGALYWVEDWEGASEEPSVLIAAPPRLENMTVMGA